MSNQEPTMQDVADAAGVSRMTVSLSLRHHPSIPSSTARRIIRIAAEMGYRPNPLVSARMAAQKPRAKSTALEYLPRRWRRQEFAKWVRRHKPDAVIGIGPAIRQALAEESNRSGHAYIYVRLDLQQDAAVGGIDQNSFMVGSAAVDNVVAQINANVRGLSPHPKSILIAGTWKDAPLDVVRPEVPAGKG